MMILVGPCEKPSKMRDVQEEQLHVLFTALHISPAPAAAEVNPEAKQRSADLFGAGNYVAAAQSFPGTYQRPPTLDTECLQIRVAGVISMDQALESWRSCYNIDEEAYNQLRILLMSRQPPEIAHFTDGNYANLLPTGSVLDHQSIISPGLSEAGMANGGFSNAGLTQGFLETGMANGGFSIAGLTQGSLETGMANGGFSNAGLGPYLLETGMANGGFLNAGLGPCLLETGMANEGISNGSLGRWHGDPFSTSTHELDFLGLTSNERLNESPGDGNFHASSELDNATVQSTALVATQSNQESLSRPRPCTRCWKKKLGVRLFIA